MSSPDSPRSRRIAAWIARWRSRRATLRCGFGGAIRATLAGDGEARSATRINSTPSGCCPWLSITSEPPRTLVFEPARDALAGVEEVRVERGRHLSARANFLWIAVTWTTVLHATVHAL